jgi:hypothetical protein
MERSTLNLRWYLAIAVALAIAMASSGCARVPRRSYFPKTQPPPTPDVVLATWLTKNCKVGEDSDLESYMRKYGQQIIARLINAFTIGPDNPQTIGEITAYAKSQAYELQLKADFLGLDPNAASRIRSLNPDDFARQALDEFIRAYKSSALAGLAVIRSPQAIARIQSEAANPQSEFQGVAAAILAQMKIKR